MFEINLINIVSAIITLLLIYWAYVTTNVFIKRRQYQHIPGPETRGYLFKLLNIEYQ